MITCKYCNRLCMKHGKQKNGQQRVMCENLIANMLMILEIVF
jgi:hypothetical protein